MHKSKATDDVLAERERQYTEECNMAEGDDEYADGVLSRAAACYALGAFSKRMGNEKPPAIWPWDQRWWKPKNPRRDLVRAAALIIAEIDRLDRKVKP